MKRIAIVGGIGTGKSVVSRILRAMGYPVYDSDTEARRLMDADSEIKDVIRNEIHSGAVSDAGCIRRDILAEAVFSDEAKRLRLNEVTHSAVRNDFVKWCSATAQPVVFVECAILCESGMIRHVDEIWEVTAPEALRVERVCRRNSLAPEQVLRRMAAQNAEYKALRSVERVVIVNDEESPLLPQIENALN